MDPVTDARTAIGCSLAAEVVRSFGEVRLQVTGTSMLPSVWPGDILTICRADVSQVLPGEIVLFARESRLLAHRVLRKLGNEDEPLIDPHSTLPTFLKRLHLIGKAILLYHDREARMLRYLELARRLVKDVEIA